MKTTYILRAKKWTLAVLFAVFVGGSIMAAVAPMSSPVLAVTTTCAKAKPILSFPVWYRGLNASADNCELVTPDAVGGIGPFIWRIVLNVIDIGLQLAGYIAVGFILYGGFQFMISQGSPDGSTKARKTILNAVIGLVISIASVAIINLIVGVMK